MNINDLTIGEAKELANLFGNSTDSSGLNGMIGEKVIIRTYSAGVFFGKLVEKSGNEVILENARRLWLWQAKSSISLSAVAIDGVNESGSKICGAVESIWLEAIEILPCTSDAIKSIEGAKSVKAS
jgi:hypothetical protein